MLTFILWVLLFCISWPLALLALILYPLIWVILLPFRLVGATLSGVFRLLSEIIALPGTLLGRLTRSRRTA